MSEDVWPLIGWIDISETTGQPFGTDRVAVEFADPAAIGDLFARKAAAAAAGEPGIWVQTVDRGLLILPVGEVSITFDPDDL